MYLGKNPYFTGFFTGFYSLKALIYVLKERLELLVEQMKAGTGITEELKATDQMKWVGLMNNVRSSAEEIVLKELIYV